MTDAEPPPADGGSPIADASLTDIAGDAEPAPDGSGVSDAEPEGDAMEGDADAGSTPSILAAFPVLIDLGTIILGDRALGVIRIRNEGPSNARLVETIIGSPFRGAADGCIGSLLAPLAECAIEVWFEPVAAGPVAAFLEVRADDGGFASASLGGTCLEPARLLISPEEAAFPATQVGETSQAQLTVENVGQADAMALEFRVAGSDATEFRFDGGCDVPALGPGASCTVALTFAPAAAGGQKTAVLIAEGAPGGIALAHLTGDGIGRALLVPRLSNVGLDETIVGRGSGQRIYFENAGGGPTGPVSPTVIGPDAADFFLGSGSTGLCFGGTLGFDGGCDLDVGLLPQSVPGLKRAAVELTSPIGGTATVMVVAEVRPLPGPTIVVPSQLEFGQRVVGTVSNPIFPQLSNDQGAVGGADTYTLTGPDAAEFRIVPETGCPCPWGVEFRPTIAGNKSATFTGTSGSFSYVVALSGGAVPAASLRFTASRVFETLTSLTSRTYPLTLQNNTAAATSPLTVQLTGSADYSISTDGCTGLALAPAATCQVRVRLIASGFTEVHARLSATTPTEEAFVQLGSIVQPIIRFINVTTSGLRGTITGPGIDCPANCRTIYSGPTALTAVPEPGSFFVGWTGDCTGTGTCLLQGSQSTFFANAEFARGPQPLTVVMEGRGGGFGSVSNPSLGISCTGPCSYFLEHRTDVVLEARPSPGSSFEGWGGDCTGLAETCAVEMTSSRTVHARFAPTNRVFVTSSTVSLLSLASVQNADLECQSLAAAMGDFGNYVAWVSTGTISALARLAATEPTPRGWSRTDGLHFADSLVDLTRGRVLFPALLTEAGDELPASALVATATFDHGNRGLDCFGWSSPGSVYQRGHAHAGSHGWTDHELGTCLDLEAHLYCFGVDYRGPAEIVPRAGDRLTFVSSSVWDPSTGIVAADGLCQSEAAAAALPGTFFAFMATSAIVATTRVDLGGPPWSRTDGVPLVAAGQDLAGSLLGALTVEADGRTHAGDARVWTGVVVDPTLPGSAASTCLDWTTSSSVSFGSVGDASLTTAEWADNLSPARCNEPHRVYCFQRQ